LHIGWRYYFSLREERIFAEGAEAFSVPQGVGSGLLNKCSKSLEAYLFQKMFCVIINNAIHLKQSNIFVSLAIAKMPVINCIGHNNRTLC
jgi:hypothetical protein